MAIEKVLEMNYLRRVFPKKGKLFVRCLSDGDIIAGMDPTLLIRIVYDGREAYALLGRTGKFCALGLFINDCCLFNRQFGFLNQRLAACSGVQYSGFP
jgi:hypothetical protein